MNYLSICAIFRNEKRYLKEWLDFHIKQGVEHFYLYDNGSDDKPLELLKGYIERGLVSYKEYHGIAKQKEVYAMALKAFRTHTRWMAFIDIDEFLFAKEGRLSTVLAESYDLSWVSAVAVHWILYGSSGETKYRNKPVTERFTMRDKDVNQHVKSIVKMNHVIGVGNDVHTFRVRHSVVDENLNKLPADYALHNPATADYLRIAHFHTKSKEEYLQKRKLPKADTGNFVDAEEHFAAHDKNDLEERIVW